MEDIFEAFEKALEFYTKAHETRVVVIIDDIPAVDTHDLTQFFGKLLNLYTKRYISVFFLAGNYQGVDNIQQGNALF